MNRLRGAELRKKVAVTTLAILGMTGLSGCGDFIDGYSAPKTVPEARIYKQEGDTIRPALMKIGGQAITFWQKMKGEKFSRKTDAYELKTGSHDYYLSIHTQRGGRYYDIDVELTSPKDPTSVYDIDVNSASDPNDEFGISFDLAAKPWSASITNYYTDYNKVKGKIRKKVQTYGDSTDNYMPGMKEIDGYDGYQQEDANQIMEVTRQSVRAAEHAVGAALTTER